LITTVTLLIKAAAEGEVETEVVEEEEAAEEGREGEEEGGVE
jgi:hypothetical protein